MPTEPQKDLPELATLTLLLKVIVELLPRHSVDCGVHSAHPSYGSRYCNCKLPDLRKQVREWAVK